MTERFTQVIERWGRSAVVTHRGSERAVKALLQPMTPERAAEPFAATELGAASERVWRYLGPAAAEIDMGDLVRAGEMRWRVRSAAAVHVGEEIAYRWAALVPEESV